jgi:hypothetical protein
MKDGPFLERIELPHTVRRKRAIGMYHTTAFSRDEVIDLCVLINSAERAADATKWPPILGLFKSVTITLAYMRHNRTQSERPGRAHSHGRRTGPGYAVHRGRDAASLLVMGRAARTLLGKAQDHRNEHPARMHDLRPARLDFRPRQRSPSR